MKLSILLIIMAALLLNACSLTVTELKKFDESAYTIIHDSKLTPECKAGIANGLIVAADQDAGTRAVAKEMQGQVDVNGVEYKQCYLSGLYWSFWRVAGKSAIGKVLKELVAAGVPIPTP